MIHKKDIQIRDPFILPDREKCTYYLFGTTDKDPWHKGVSFQAYTSADLELWEGPYTVFEPPAGFWGDSNFWAPEVFHYRDGYYMFASFKSSRHARGTQILFSASQLGPFIPVANNAATPADWECLDGTLFIDEEQNPWIVFCHEWQQVRDGTICAQRLTPDLRGVQGEVFTLFSASEAPWVDAFRDNCFVTDGPCLYRTEKGILVMLWSSFRGSRYAIGLAHSLSGHIQGPWVHHRETLFADEGGHCMLFCDFRSRILIAYHSPNQTPMERMVIREMPAVPGLPGNRE